jgi:hypothetical protein
MSSALRKYLSYYQHADIDEPAVSLGDFLLHPLTRLDDASDLPWLEPSLVELELIDAQDIWNEAGEKSAALA